MHVKMLLLSTSDFKMLSPYKGFFARALFLYAGFSTHPFYSDLPSKRAHIPFLISSAVKALK